jgi:hypothetical protein
MREPTIAEIMAKYPASDEMVAAVGRLCELEREIRKDAYGPGLSINTHQLWWAERLCSILGNRAGEYDWALSESQAKRFKAQGKPKPGEEG